MASRRRQEQRAIVIRRITTLDGYQVQEALGTSVSVKVQAGKVVTRKWVK